MKRLLVVLAAVALVGWFATPAHATMAERTKYDSKGYNACGFGNSFELWSYVAADIGGSPQDEVAYNAKPNNFAFKDLRVDLTDGAAVEDIDVKIWKQQADGTGWTQHWHQIRYFGSSMELFEFAAVNNVNKDRHPYLQVNIDWNDGSCGSKTAWDNDWFP